MRRARQGDVLPREHVLPCAEDRRRERQRVRQLLQLDLREGDAPDRLLERVEGGLELAEAVAALEPSACELARELDHAAEVVAAHRVEDAVEQRLEPRT